jgi:hypothetical protein
MAYYGIGQTQDEQDQQDAMDLGLGITLTQGNPSDPLPYQLNNIKANKRSRVTTHSGQRSGTGSSDDETTASFIGQQQSIPGAMQNVPPASQQFAIYQNTIDEEFASWAVEQLLRLHEKWQHKITVYQRLNDYQENDEIPSELRFKFTPPQVDKALDERTMQDWIEREREICNNASKERFRVRVEMNRITMECAKKALDEFGSDDNLIQSFRRKCNTLADNREVYIQIPQYVRAKFDLRLSNRTRMTAAANTTVAIDPQVINPPAETIQTIQLSTFANQQSAMEGTTSGRVADLPVERLMEMISGIVDKKLNERGQHRDNTSVTSSNHQSTTSNRRKNRYGRGRDSTRNRDHHGSPYQQQRGRSPSQRQSTSFTPNQPQTRSRSSRGGRGRGGGRGRQRNI